LPNGEIEFLGREDSQLKLNGRRVELGEVEAAMREHIAVDQSVVTVSGTSAGGQQLCGFYTASRELCPSTLRIHLEERLPSYLVPRRLIRLDNLPLTANGKLDRDALPSAEAAPSPAPAAAATKAEQQLLEVWSHVLGVSIHDPELDFFALGGDSMSAVRVTLEVERRFAQRLPLSALLSAPTVRLMAAQLSNATSSIESDRSLVPLRSEGSESPVFCVHPIGGSLFCYGDLVRALPQVPFFGLQSLGFEGGEPTRSVAEMASRYLAELRSVRPRGPYVLFGWSFGGVVAHEMMRQLESEGERGTLIMLDSYLLREDAKYGPRSESEFATSLLVDVAHQHRHPLESDELVRRLSDCDLSEQLRRAIELRVVPASMTLTTLRRIVSVFSANCAAYDAFEPGVVSAPAQLLVADDHRFVGSESDVEAWRPFFRSAPSISQLAGDHYSILVGASLSRVAAAVAAAARR
jgi:thioesterase domain-containing protein/acyl carrier protein